jgi:phosphomannomutase
VSGEINTEVKSPKILLEKIKEYYLPFDPIIDDIDGYSFEFPDWRFNLRMSNTEPLVRLNVESRANKTLMQKKTEEILKLINRLN